MTDVKIVLAPGLSRVTLDEGPLEGPPLLLSFWREYPHSL